MNAQSANNIIRIGITAMIDGYKYHTAKAKNRLTHFADLLSGPEKKFDIPHRFFNLSVIILMLYYITGILVSPFFRIRTNGLIWVQATTAAGFLVIYGLSRYAKKMHICRWLLMTLVLLSFCLGWFFTGGTSGVVLYYYFIPFAAIIFLSEKKQRVWVLMVILACVSLVFLLEYMFPKLVIPVIPDQELILNRVLYFFFTVVFIFIMIQIISYYINIQHISIIEHFNQKSEHESFPESGNGAGFKLTFRENEILRMIMEGKRNREIAELLHIDICTVKTHINNIVKKIGAFGRPASRSPNGSNALLEYSDNL